MNIITSYPVTIQVTNPYSESDSVSLNLKVIMPSMLIGDSYGPGRIIAVTHPGLMNMTNSPTASGTPPLWMTVSTDLGKLFYKSGTSEYTVNLADLTAFSNTASGKIIAKYFKSILYYLEGASLFVDNGLVANTAQYWYKFISGSLGLNSGTSGGSFTASAITTTGDSYGVFNGSSTVGAPGIVQTGSWTIECWVNGSGQLYSCGYANHQNTNGVFVLRIDRGAVPWTVASNGIDSVYFNSNICPNAGIYHFALTMSGYTQYCFINGVLLGSSYNTYYAYTGLGPYPVLGAPQIGSGFVGSLGNVKIYTYPKYTSSFTPDPMPSSLGLTGIGTPNGLEVSSEGYSLMSIGSTGVSVINTADKSSMGPVISTTSIGGAISADGTKAFVGSTVDNLAGIYTISTGAQVLSLSKKQNPAYNSIINRVAFATSVEDGAFNIVIYNVSTLALVTTITVPLLVTSLKFNYNGTELIVGFNSSSMPMKRYNTSDWSEITNLGDLTGVIYNPNSTICMIP